LLPAFVSASLASSSLNVVKFPNGTYLKSEEDQNFLWVNKGNHFKMEKKNQDEDDDETFKN